jgi:hypothetical protein
VAATDDGDDVADDGSSGRGDDADGAGKGWEQAFTGGVEETFAEKAGFELFEGELECSGTERVEGFGDELELAARLVDGDASFDEDGQAVSWAETEEGGLAAEKNDGELGVAVFEGEVEVAGGSEATVGNLAFDEKAGVGGLDLVADVGYELVDRPDAARKWIGGCGLWSKGLLRLGVGLRGKEVQIGGFCRGRLAFGAALGGSQAGQCRRWGVPVRHCLSLALGVRLVGEERGGFAEEQIGLAWLGEDAYRPGQTCDVLLHGGEVRVEAGEEEDAAVGQFSAYLLHKMEAVFAGHGDVTEEEIGLEVARGGERLVGRVCGPGLEAALAKDERNGVCYQTFIVDDKYSIHGPLQQ